MVAAFSGHAFGALLSSINCNFRSPSGESGNVQIFETVDGLQLYFQGSSLPYSARILETNESRVVGQFQISGAGPFPGQTVIVSVDKVSLAVSYRSSSPNLDVSISSCIKVGK
jgi:hypothetical protein